ncbi:phosphotransferase [Polluticoccus soli]|uniref:RapZ C-terminal domain-containing protein n=1 Tax=Polluticoccus soli TaxID=3034150 RepID=UPI0023E0A886|nr:RNase adapter RapZ [Flavipsychrobacter sp. JY13-12]
MTPVKSSAQTISTLEKLFEDHFGIEAEKVDLLPVSGSDRRYFRLNGAGHTAIGTYNANTAENNTYFYFTELFRKHEINVPEVFKISKDRKAYLQQDLGTTSLFDKLMKDGLTDEVRKSYHQALEQLAKLQWVAGREADFYQCFATRQFDEKAIMGDLLYFKYYFADLQGLHYDKATLMSEMEQMSRELGRIQPQMLMYRDFQSRNVMLHDGKAFFIDFQGAMQGPPQYDIASLLWQAKAQLPDAWKEDLLNGYIASMNKLHVSRVEEIHFRKGYLQFVLLRLLQVLGAYGFRGLLQNKPHFVSSIGPALKSLANFLADNPQAPAYPEMRSLLERLSSPAMQSRYSKPPRGENAKLEVQVCSFSYKNGIPKDKSSHGGGFVFDCRGILNPGRFAAYKHNTGHDENVRQFLEHETNMPQFLQHAYGLVSYNVDDYLSRGFEHLSIAFGCTGGQHRSVYAAEQMASYLSNKYNIPVTVTHLNEKKWVLSPETNTTEQ